MSFAIALKVSFSGSRNSYKGVETCNSRSMLVNIHFYHIWKPSWQISILNKWLGSPCRCFKTRVLHFEFKRQKMERKSSKECSAFFLWRKECFSSRNRPSRNSNLFSSRRSAWSVLKCNQVSEVFAEFSGTFCTLWPRQLRFWKGIYVFLNVS